MALVTICKYRRAKTPYFLEQAGLNMYSLEELAWFLYHNICLAEPQMFDDRLCRWLEEEIGSSELARRIRNGKESGTNFQNLVISVVGAVDLFTNQELAELGEQLKSLGTMQEQERLKVAGEAKLRLEAAGRAQRMGGSGRVSKNPADASEHPAWRRVLCGSMEQSGNLLCAAVPV